MLPPYMKNRPASSFVGTLQDLEANVVLAMGHRFAPVLRGTLSSSSLTDLNAVEMFDGGSPQGFTGGAGLTHDQAAFVVDAALEEFRTVSPHSSPVPTDEYKVPTHEEGQERHPKRARRAPPRNRAKDVAYVKTRPSCTLPTADDPADESFFASLYVPGEEGRINPAHAIVRRDVLLVRKTISGRVYFQCACCKHRPLKERSARQSTINPTSVSRLYRAMVRFMMNHVAKCEDIPQEIRELSPKVAKTVQARGTKAYWAESAARTGLRDAEDGTGIVFCRPCDEAN